LFRKPQVYHCGKTIIVAMVEPRQGNEPRYDIDELRRLITPILSRYDVDRAFIFGSYARGDARGVSDMGLRIDADRLRTLDLCGLMVRLEEALGIPVDVIPTDSMSAGFLEAIKGEEVMVYER